jgi:hypothetical protein
MTKRFIHVLATTCGGLVCLAAPVQAQRLARVLPDAALAPVIRADPRAPVAGAKLVQVTSPASEFGRGLEGEAQLGHSFPLWMISGESADRAVVLGIQGGVFGRFLMTSEERELITSDWMFGVPLYIWRGDTWFRFRYRHFSSHLGDEYVERTGAERLDYTRDSFGVMAYTAGLVRGLGVYAGGDVAINVDPHGAGRVALQGGVEYTGETATGRLPLFGGVDVYLDEDSSWKPRVNMQAGIAVPANNRRRLRFQVEVLFGPSPQGEFHRLDETLLTLGVGFDL